MQSTVNDPKINAINDPSQHSNHTLNVINERGSYFKETPSIRRIDCIEYGVLTNFQTLQIQDPKLSFRYASEALNHQVDYQTIRRATKIRKEPQDHKKTLVIFAQPNTRIVFGFPPYPFNYPTRRLAIEEMLDKFIDEGKREHEEMKIFIREFRTTNELLLKEQSNLLSELKIDIFPTIVYKKHDIKSKCFFRTHCINTAYPGDLAVNEIDSKVLSENTSC
ncbi:hypothetical protein Tco_0883496 [Tanacetum coccineum]